jgi:L-2-hydroxyglutarate oxidase LhgO
MRIAVVGGGIVGLAAARLIAREHPAYDVTVLEKEPELALHQTGHNSGVVHAGLYYEPGSLKARLCRRGVSLLRDFCAAHEVQYEECGKLVIATTEHELNRLNRLEERARANSVPGLRRLNCTELQRIEPHAVGIAALHSPVTAIVDFQSVALALADELRARGGVIRMGTAVERIDCSSAQPRVVLAGDDALCADRVIVCAGLHADRLARASGQSAAPRIIPFRGEYWQLKPERAKLVRGLIYPVPDPALPFLGVHLTRKIDGSVWLGPSAILATAREGYRRRRVVLRDVADTLAWPGTARLVRRHWRAGVQEIGRALLKSSFISDAQRFVPALTAADAIRAPAGVRAQAVDRDGNLVDDFRVTRNGGVVWVRNAPSPAATSSLAIAEELVAAAGLD